MALANQWPKAIRTPVFPRLPRLISERKVRGVGLLLLRENLFFQSRARHRSQDRLKYWLAAWLTDSLINRQTYRQTDGRSIDRFLTTERRLPWLPSLLFASKMAAISSSSSVVLFDDIPVSLTRTGMWYCLSKHLPDKNKKKMIYSCINSVRVHMGLLKLPFCSHAR